MLYEAVHGAVPGNVKFTHQLICGMIDLHLSFYDKYVDM